MITCFKFFIPFTVPLINICGFYNQSKSIEKSLSSGLVSTLAGWDVFFKPWPILTVESLSFVSARKVVRWLEFRLRKDDVSASSNVEGLYFPAGSLSHASSSSLSRSFSDSEDFFFENIFSLRL